jgi:hypothetical protein
MIKTSAEGKGSAKKSPAWITNMSGFDLRQAQVRGKSELAVALHIYRLRSIRHSRTITVSNGPLAELEIDRFAKYRALRRLAEADLIRIKSNNRKALNVSFCR